ncbi:hypothetical protein [Streptomyces phaeochromogenes]|uniref:hypothetical protein n=1 Tax=Streptomyces phaeochromogenes TaxID=1923 RepID=UPI0037171402
MADVEDLLDETGLRLPSAAAEVRARGTRRRTRRRATAAAAAVVAVALGAALAVLPGEKTRAARPPTASPTGERAYDFQYDNPYNRNGKIRLWGLNRFATPVEAGWEADRKSVDVPLPSLVFDLPCTYSRADGRFQKRWTASFHADNGAVFRHRYMEYDTKAHAGRQLLYLRNQLAACDVRPRTWLPGKVEYQGVDKKGRNFDIVIEYGERWISVRERSNWVSWERHKS